MGMGDSRCIVSSLGQITRSCGGFANISGKAEVDGLVVRGALGAWCRATASNVTRLVVILLHRPGTRSVIDVSFLGEHARLVRLDRLPGTALVGQELFLLLRFLRPMLGPSGAASGRL